MPRVPKRKTVHEELEAFEKAFQATRPTEAQQRLWKKTKTRLDSRLKEMLEAGTPPARSRKLSSPVILVVTPEIIHLPPNMGSLANVITTGDGGGLADISAALVAELDRQGVNVHVTLPEYQNLFTELSHITRREYATLRSRLGDENRIHPITDDIFKIARRVYDDKSSDLDQINLRRSTAFMRGVISRLMPILLAQSRHLLVHCNDWMTGLIPAVARRLRIPCLFTIHNIHTVNAPTAFIEDRGIDAASFWQHLYYMHYASSYESARESNPVDFLTSGIFSAHFVNTVSPTFLLEVVAGQHPSVEPQIRERIAGRLARGKVECRLGVQHAAGAESNRLNPAALAGLQRLGGLVRQALPEAAPLSVADVLGWPGVLESPPLDPEALRAAVLTALEAVLDRLQESRAREGSAIADGLRSRCDAISAIVGNLRDRLPELRAAVERKLTERLNQALGAPLAAAASLTREEVVAAAKKHKLVVASMIGHNSLPDGLNKRSNHDRIEAELRESIDIAAAHGIPGVICFSGNRQPHQTTVEAITAVRPTEQRQAQRTALELRQTFNVQPVAWGGATGRFSIEDFPHLSTRLQELWPTPACAGFLAHLLEDNRGGTRNGLPQCVAEEILLLEQILGSEAVAAAA